MANRRFVWFELFYDLIVVAALVNGLHVFEGKRTVSLGAWLAATLAVMLVLWMLTALHANLYRSDDWPRRILVLIQMLSIVVALLAVGRVSESLPDTQGFVALGIAFLSIALMYRLSDQPEHRSEARLVMWSMGIGGVILIAGSPFAESGARIEGPLFAAGALAGCGPVYFTLLKRVVEKRKIDVEHFSERLGALLVLVLGESFVEVMIHLDGYTEIPNPPVLVFALIATFGVWTCYFNGIEPRGMPRGGGVGPIRCWLLAYYLLLFGLMALAARCGLLVVEPWRDTFALPLLYNVLPLIYITVALVALWQISRRHAGIAQGSSG